MYLSTFILVLASSTLRSRRSYSEVIPTDYKPTCCWVSKHARDQRASIVTDDETTPSPIPLRYTWPGNFSTGNYCSSHKRNHSKPFRSSIGDYICAPTRVVQPAGPSSTVFSFFLQRIWMTEKKQQRLVSLRYVDVSQNGNQCWQTFVFRRFGRSALVLLRRVVVFRLHGISTSDATA